MTSLDLSYWHYMVLMKFPIKLKNIAAIWALLVNAIMFLNECKASKELNSSSAKLLGTQMLMTRQNLIKNLSTPCQKFQKNFDF